MSLNKDTKSFDNNQKGPVTIMTSEEIAEWMRTKDWAFDFRGADHWSRSGGIGLTRYDVNLLK